MQDRSGTQKFKNDSSKLQVVDSSKLSFARSTQNQLPQLPSKMHTKMAQCTQAAQTGSITRSIQFTEYKGVFIGACGQSRRVQTHPSPRQVAPHQVVQELGVHSRPPQDGPRVCGNTRPNVIIVEISAKALWKRAGRICRCDLRICAVQILLSVWPYARSVPPIRPYTAASDHGNGPTGHRGGAGRARARVRERAACTVTARWCIRAK